MGLINKPFSWLVAGLRWRLQALSGKIRAAKESAEARFRQAARITDPEERLIRESQKYWNDSLGTSLKQNSHWRGAGIFADDSRWLALGLAHLDLYKEFARAVGGKAPPLERVLEWGCGGGMNAVHFGRLTREFYGVDISAASLAECERQMTAEGLTNFRPVLIESDRPETVLGQVPKPCEVLLSTYVFELLPTPEHGLRVLRIAYDLLAPEGIAIIQIKYSEGDWKTMSKRWAYSKNLAWNATYRIEEFWKEAEKCGFSPRLVKLLPYEPLVNDRNYAYFLLQKVVKTVPLAS